MIIVGDLFFIVYMEVLQNKMFHIVSYKMFWTWTRAWTRALKKKIYI